MKKQDFWATPVWHLDLPSIDPKLITEEAYRRRSEDVGQPPARSGGYNSQSIRPAMAYPETKRLITLIERLAQAPFEEFGFSHTCKIMNFWYNINGHRDYNVAHNHPTATLSAVYWSQTPQDCGDLVLHNRVENDYIQMTWGGNKDNNYNVSKIKVNPVPGRLLLFPSWVYHSVDCNLSQEDRISLAFNLS